MSHNSKNVIIIQENGTNELTVTAQQLASVAQLVRALHRNRRAVGSIPTRGPCAAFFAVVPG